MRFKSRRKSSIEFLTFVFMQLRAQIIKVIQDYFRTKPVISAHLFGSYARNTAVEGVSDIDILVVLDYNQRIGLEFIQMKLDLENILNQKVDLVSSNGISEYIKPFIEMEKQLIYQR